jgi:hypothetical protein
MALAAFVCCGAQKTTIAKAHETVCRRNPAAPFRQCPFVNDFETLRFTKGECIMESIMAWDAPLLMDRAPHARGLVKWAAPIGTGPGETIAKLASAFGLRDRTRFALIAVLFAVLWPLISSAS